MGPARSFGDLGRRVRLDIVAKPQLAVVISQYLFSGSLVSLVITEACIGGVPNIPYPLK